MRKKLLAHNIKRSQKKLSNKSRALIGVYLGITFLVILIFPIEVTKDYPEEIFTTTIDPINKTILDSHRENYTEKVPIGSLILGAAGKYVSFSSLATPGTTYIHINEGLRKEEIADQISKKLKWSASDREIFLKNDLLIPEGTFHPGDYIVSNKETPLGMKKIMNDRFEMEISNRYPLETRQKVPLQDALIIASLIEREAAYKQDMRLISGVIWNRLWNGMTLDIDATLQYAKGTEKNKWWPRVTTNDKFIASPFNTYKQIGLPPAPISNPGALSIRAALNPEKTNCLYYLHDLSKEIHCSEDYEGHLKNIERYYKN